MISNPYDLVLTGVGWFQCELGRPMRRGYASFNDDGVRYGRPNAQADGGASEGKQEYILMIHKGIIFVQWNLD